jgi:LacI family transcriptional regulator
MRALLRLPEPPDAVAAASDHSALGAMRAVSEAGLRVPADVAVVGFDDSAIAALVHPTLTTVRQDKDAIGEVACNGLLDLVEGGIERPRNVTLPVELVIRESCGAPSPSS